MADVDITVIESNASQRIINRPLRRVDGKFFVVFKKQRWVVDHRLTLDRRAPVYLPEDIPLSLATDDQVSNLLQQHEMWRRNNSSASVPIASTTQPDPPKAESGNPKPLLVVVPAKDPSYSDFDEVQKAVIESSPAARQLVDAGPGTGKTAVACARVAWLAGKKNIPPSQIWLISFTRTAVAEIRNRVRRLIDPVIANAVQMATIDSLAWQINPARNAGSFDENIRSLHGNLSDNEDVQNYIQDLRHLIIDEAQDIVGVRAELLLELLRILPTSCGVSIFSDEAQAIYGFAAAEEDEQETDDEPKPCLPVQIRSSELGQSFETRILEQVHRTKDSKLELIFTKVRLDVLKPINNGDALGRNASVREQLKQLAHSEAPRNIEDTVAGLPDDAFVLFRNRMETIRASMILRRAKIAHRLRMSGLPFTIPPWIAGALGHTTEPKVSQKAFMSLWKDNVANTPLATTDPETAFNLLFECAPDRTGRFLDVEFLRNQLARKPPISLSHVEQGITGPIVGTIHASKGREAASVTLMMPKLPNENQSELEIDEETRTLFVAATRARQQFRIADASPVYGKKTSLDRSYRFRKTANGPKCDLEIGRSGDINVTGLAGRHYFDDSAVVLRNKKKWIDLATSGTGVEIYKRKIGSDWVFCICTEYGADVMAVLPQSLDDDLYEVARHGVNFYNLDGRPYKPKKLTPIFVVGLTTIAATTAESEVLLEPWKTSGLLVAPIIYGLPRFSLKAFS